MLHTFIISFYVLSNYRPPHARDFFQNCARGEPWSNPNILYPDEAQVLHSLPTKSATLSLNFCVREARFGTAPTASGSPTFRSHEDGAAHAPGRSGGAARARSRGAARTRSTLLFTS